MQFAPQQVAPRVAGDVDRGLLGQGGVLAPELGVLFAPGEQVADMANGRGMKPPREVGLRRQVHQRLLVPGDDVVAELGGGPEKQQAPDRHALGQIDAARELVDEHFHLAPGADDRGIPPARGNAREQQLGVELAHLIFHRDQQQWLCNRHVPERLRRIDHPAASGLKHTWRERSRFH